MMKLFRKVLDFSERLLRWAHWFTEFCNVSWFSRSFCQQPVHHAVGTRDAFCC